MSARETNTPGIPMPEEMRMNPDGSKPSNEFPAREVPEELLKWQPDFKQPLPSDVKDKILLVYTKIEFERKRPTHDIENLLRVVKPALFFLNSFGSSIPGLGSFVSDYNRDYERLIGAKREEKH